MKKPLISIIVPVYNVENYLFQCLDSIIHQTYSNIEIIVVNDGSPDNSHLIINTFSEKDKRIKIINKENGGLSDARNFGIMAADGDYIMFVDSDDWLEFNLIELLVGQILNRDLVACSYNRCYEDKKIPRVFDIEGEIDGTLFQRRMLGLLKNELSDPSQIDSLSTAWGKLYKTSLLVENKLRFVSTKEIGTEDLLFNLHYCTNLNRVYVINLPLYNYRRNNSSSLTSNYKPNLFNNWQHLFSLIKDLIVNKEADFKEAFNNRIAISIVGLGLNELQNPKSFSLKIKNLKNILNHPTYVAANQNLKLNYFPVHWKLFFYFSKKRIVLGLFFLLHFINYFINRNNK